MPLDPGKSITPFAQTNFRNEFKKFGIKQADRLAHMYIIGKTSTGKSTLLEPLIRQDIDSGQGVALLDPHRDLVERVLKYVPSSRRADLVYFDVPDTDRPLGFNPLAPVPAEKKALAASGPAGSLQGEVERFLGASPRIFIEMCPSGLAGSTPWNRDALK